MCIRDRIKKAIEIAKDEGKGKWGGKIPANLKTPLRDGDIDRPEDEAYADSMFLNANSKQAPQLSLIHIWNGDFYIIRFGTRGGIQVRSNRLFASYEDADSSIDKKTEKRTGYRSPYDYIHSVSYTHLDVYKRQVRRRGCAVL